MYYPINALLTQGFKQGVYTECSLGMAQGTIIKYVQ